MAPEETYTRRVCAVLLADVTGFSAMMGEDDEGTARAVEQLNVLVQGIVAETGGHAEPASGDSMFATFESVVGAVDAAIQIQRRLATEELGPRRLQIRIGVHLGDVLLREGAAFGDAINIGARLQALARPGTICISDSVYRHVHRKFDESFEDLGRQRLKNISDPVHAYLIVPGKVKRGGLWRRAGSPWVMGGTVVLLLAALAVHQYRVRVPEKAKDAPVTTETTTPAAPTQHVAAEAPAEAAPIALGVMLFKSLGGDGAHGWMREALRDGLNAQLSELSKVRVYSKEFIDFLTTRKKLSEVEAASQLGITKMLSGSFVVVGKSLRIETHVVDVVSGVLESSYTTEGRAEDFFDLQNKVVLGVIARLDLPVNEEEKRALLARREKNVEALRLLLEAEGSTRGAAPQAPPRPLGGGGESALPRWLASLRLPSPSAAHAEEAGGEEPSILAMLERYRRAVEARELEALADVYVDFTAEQQAAQQRYFENVRDLRIAIESVDIAVVGNEAVVSYTRTDDFADVRTGRPMHVSVRLTKTLRREDGTWKIAPAE
jgi:class 3 adenylate cyclase/TolB-like protein/ketosteroid isomerase-like protein